MQFVRAGGCQYDKESLNRTVEASIVGFLAERGLVEQTGQTLELTLRYDIFPKRGNGYRQGQVRYVTSNSSENPRAICLRVQPVGNDTCRDVMVVFPQDSGRVLGLGVGAGDNADIQEIKAKLGESEPEEIPTEEAVLSDLAEQAETIPLPKFLALFTWCIFSFLERLQEYYTEIRTQIHVSHRELDASAAPLLQEKDEATRLQKELEGRENLSVSLKKATSATIKVQIAALQEKIDPIEARLFELEELRGRAETIIETTKRFREFLQTEFPHSGEHRGS